METHVRFLVAFESEFLEFLALINISNNNKNGRRGAFFSEPPQRVIKAAFMQSSCVNHFLLITDNVSLMRSLCAGSASVPKVNLITLYQQPDFHPPATFSLPC